jgi:apolipoprotein N-acyltransferase
VPFGEYIPLRSLARRISSQVDLVARDFVAGDAVGVLDVGRRRLGRRHLLRGGLRRPGARHRRRGGRLLVVQTNNATFGRSPQTEQQLAMSRLRAVEHRRTVVVAPPAASAPSIARTARWRTGPRSSPATSR